MDTGLEIMAMVRIYMIAMDMNKLVLSMDMVPVDMIVMNMDIPFMDMPIKVLNITKRRDIQP